ncbi:MAG TPA: FecR domain-containing protein [Magnetococcales bacterium]|nr:FecR domain-containing protein [Magnetococcales bacterium]
MVRLVSRSNNHGIVLHLFLGILSLFFSLSQPMAAEGTGGQNSVSAAAQPSGPVHAGRITFLEKTVRLEGESGTRTPVLNDPILVSDTLITEAASKAVITFRDGSKMTVGPDSRIRVSEYSFSPAESQATSAVDIVKGAFRYNSGFKVKKPSVSFNTPMALVGVRGTALEGVVEENVPFFMMLSEGEGLLSNKGGQLPLSSGQATAFSSGRVLPPGADKMPPTLTEQGMGYVVAELGSAEPPSPTLTPEQILIDAQMNQLSITDQQRASKTDPRKKQSLLAPSSLFFTDLTPASAWKTFADGWGRQDFLVTSAFAAARESLALLVDAGKLNMFDAASPPSEAKANLLAQASRQYPNAAANVANHSNSQQQQTKANQQTSTKTVISGATQVAPNLDEVAQIVGAAVGASSDVASLVVESALSVTGKTDNAGAASMMAAAATKADPSVAGNVSAAAVNAMPADVQAQAAVQVSAATVAIAPEAAVAVATMVTRAAGAGAAASIAAVVTQLAGASAAADIASAVTKEAGSASAASVAAAVTQVAGKAAAADIAAAVTKVGGSEVAASVAASVVQMAGADVAAAVANSVTREAGPGVNGAVAGAVIQSSGANAADVVAAVAKASGMSTDSINQAVRDSSKEVASAIANSNAANVNAKQAASTVSQAATDAGAIKESVKGIEQVVPSLERAADPNQNTPPPAEEVKPKPEEKTEPVEDVVPPEPASPS